MPEYETTLGNSLRGLRLRTGMSQLGLAERSGLSVRAVRDLERDRVTRPHAASLHRLATAMRLSEAEHARLLTAVAPRTEPGLLLAVLGPLSVRYKGKPVTVTSPTLRTLLTLLALQPQRPVSCEEIVATLWGERPPRTCRRLVHRYVGQLRVLLEPGRRTHAPAQVLRGDPGGYRLDVTAAQLDLAHFDDLVASASRLRERGEPWHARSLLAHALAAWRGPLGAGFDARLSNHPAAVALTGRRVSAALDHADLALADGAAGQAVPALRALADDQPLHEGIAARLVLSLAACGEQAAALQLFHEVRARLVDQLGVEPGPGLRNAYLAVLNGRPPRPGRGMPELPPVFPPLSAAAVADAAPSRLPTRP